MGTEGCRSGSVLTDEELRVHELGLKNNLKQAEVKTLIEYYKHKDPNNQGLLPHQFKEAAGQFIASGAIIDPNIVYNIFNTAEAGAHGRVTLREFILGYAILCRGSTENRLRYLFAIYGDTGNVELLTRDQLISSLKLMQRIVSEVSDTPDDSSDGNENDERIRQVADNIISESSDPESDSISYQDFIDKIKETDVVMSWLDKLSTVAGEHLKYIEKLELEVVELNMEREGILSGSMPRPNLSQQMEWDSASVLGTTPLLSSTITQPLDKKRKIPKPRTSQLVRRDLRSRSSTAGSDACRNSNEDMDDDEINAAKPFLINYDQIQFGKILGRGACATVYEGTWMHIPVAVKVFNDGNGEAAGIEGLATADEELRKAIVGDYVEEFWLLLQIRHPNCLLYMGICFEPVVCIITELFTGGSVTNFLHGPNARKFTPSKALEIISGVARGMYYLHASSPPILHRDLKASNILINRLVTHCVICDFGLSRQFVKEASGIDPKRRAGDNSVIGTPYTMAPEIMKLEEYTPAADVYSFGIVMYEMYVGRFPFPNMKPIQMMYYVTDKKRPVFYESDNIPPMLRDLIEKCWAHDPKDRPTFEVILEVLTSPKLIEEVESVERDSITSNGIDDRMMGEKDVDDLSKRLLDEAYHGRHEQVLRLINGGASIDYCDYDKRTALHVAAAEGKVNCMRVLIRAGAKLCQDRWKNTPIADAMNYARRTGDSEPVRLLRAIEGRDLNTNPDGSTDGFDPAREQMARKYMAMIAAANGDLVTLRRLLNDGLDVNLCDYDRRTPLMLAASEGQCEVVRELLEHGANVRNRDRWGSTAYHEAKRGGYHDIVLLIQQAEEQRAGHEAYHSNIIR